MKKCKSGYYYCNTDKKCKPIPRGYRVGYGGYLRKEKDDDDSKNKSNGNGNGNGNGSNGNGNGGNGSGGNGGGGNGGGMGEEVTHEAVAAIPMVAGGISKIPATVGALTNLVNMARKYKTRNNPTGRVGIGKKDKRIVGSGEKTIFDRQTKETTYAGEPKIRATNREIDKQKKLVDKYAKKYKTPKEKAADLQRSRLARRGEYMEDQYTPLHEDRKTFDKYMKDARGKKAEEKLPLLRKATKIHKELPDEDKK